MPRREENEEIQSDFVGKYRLKKYELINLIQI